MLLVQNEIDALDAEIAQISSSKKIVARTTLQPLRDAFNTSTNTGTSPFAILRWFTARLHNVNVEKIAARDMDRKQISNLFGLKWNPDSPDSRWQLAKESLIQPPSLLRQVLKTVSQAGYVDSEATSRYAIDTILIQSRLYLLRKLNSKEPTEIFPECTISIEIPNPSSPNSKYLVHGRADWGVGYSSKSEDGGLLVAIEAKRSSTFYNGEAQLIAYLAILRENRLRVGKTNTITQGFYSDGHAFRFIYIKEDGTVMRSFLFDTDMEKGLQMVFSFIVAMLDTAMKSTPTATPTKPGEVQDKEVHAFEDEVWSKIYKEMDKCIVYDDDGDDMTDVMAIRTDRF